MYEEKIERAADALDKRDMYAKMFGRYKLAMKNEFYLEAIFIAYAVMEDRITRFLFYAGLINDEDKLRWSKGKAKDLVQQIAIKGKNLDNISVRIGTLSALLEWAETIDQDNLSSEYEIELLNKLTGSVDLPAFRDILARIPDWIDGRNECVHALMRKNPSATDKKIKELAEESYEMIRTLDNFEKNFKRNNSLRKKFNIQ